MKAPLPSSASLVNKNEFGAEPIPIEKKRSFSIFHLTVLNISSSSPTWPSVRKMTCRK